MESPNSNTPLSSIRTDYNKKQLLKSEMDADPLKQFSLWLEEALQADPLYATSMVLSTVDQKLQPDSRIVLLKDLSKGGFTFFTSYQSKKAADLLMNSHAALLFFWPALERQVRIQGRIEKLPAVDSDQYFASRPFESQVGAWSSQQSQILPCRAKLEEDYEKNLELYKGKTIPRPEHWGGYVLLPGTIEFWQGRPSRLHDRLQYQFDPQKNSWLLQRLMP